MLTPRRTDSASTPLGTAAELRPAAGLPRTHPGLPRTRLGVPRTRLGVVSAFVRKKLGSHRHELRVAQLAAQLFRHTRTWHNLPRSDLTALRLGALLHDIGRHLDDDRHPQLGARLILRYRQLPLTPRERRIAAFLARYHRGAVPEPGHDDLLPLADAIPARILLALLRAADALDSRVTGHVHVELRPRGRTLHIAASPEHPSPKSRRNLERRKKFRLLEDTLGCTVRLKVA